MATTFSYPALIAKQNQKNKVIMFAAKAADILQFAEIQRAGRKNGKLQGFQRPQIASHIAEIRDYLSHDDAVLPNSIVIAFTEGASIKHEDNGTLKIEINLFENKPGLVVDGQQRLTALAGLPNKDFEVWVSALVCQDEEELRQQFILINNTRPLPKSLIYELLPTVQGLPGRLSSRALAAQITEQLNFDKRSSLKGLIHQHTNPRGVISDTAIQKAIMNSLADGALREIVNTPDFDERAFKLFSEYFEAVQEVFSGDWTGHTPKTSRLIHGAGIVAMGFVMEVLYARDGATDKIAFVPGLENLVGKTAWTNGIWRFSEHEILPWNKLENTPRQIAALSHYLVGVVKLSRR